MIFFHTANQALDSLHNDYSAVCTTFHNCIDLKTTVVGKQLMIYVHVTSSAKGHSMQSLLEKPTSIRSAYLYHTHMHMALCMHTCRCMPTTLSPSPRLSPLAHSNRMPQRMYASVPRYMPIARLGLIHNTMPSHIRTAFSKSLKLVNVWVGSMYMYVCMHVYVRVTKGRLKACVCLHVSVCICVCKCICVSTYAHAIMKVG